MKRHLMLTAMVAAALIAAQAARADEPASRPSRERGGDMMENIVAGLNLTPDQEPKVKQIMETFRQEAENYHREHAGDANAFREKLEDARKSGDANAMQAVREQLMKRMEGMKELWANTEKQLAEVLTKEQMDKLHERMQQRMGEGPGGGRMAGGLDKLNLTDEQKAKIQEIREQAQKDAQGKEGADAMKIHMAAFEKIVTDVLTPEQREEFKKLREGARHDSTTAPAGEK